MASVDQTGSVEKPSNDHEYWSRLRRLVEAGRQCQSVLFDDLLETTDGAFPSDVLMLARAEGVDVKFGSGSINWKDRKPDPSPARSEYYFTAQSAAQVAERLEGRVLCLGTPAVAEALALRGREATLVDSGRWVRDRFDLLGGAVMHPNGLTVEKFEDDRLFDSAVLDPPWYFPALTEWLTLASRNVVEGGKLWIPLLPALTRPSAIRDTDNVIEVANSIGPSSVTDFVVEYESPLFERRAIERSGGVVTRPWRRARMLAVTNSRQEAAPMRPRHCGSEWTDYRVADSVVSVRTGIGFDASESVQSAEWGQALTFSIDALDTVSHRDSRVKRLNVWTSENTGLTLPNPVDFALALAADEFDTQDRHPKLAALLKLLEIPA